MELAPLRSCNLAIFDYFRGSWTEGAHLGTPRFHLCHSVVCVVSPSGVGHAARRCKTPAPLSMIAVCGSTGPDTEPEPPQTAIMETAGGHLPSTRPPTPKDLRHGQLRVSKCIGPCSYLAEPDCKRRSRDRLAAGRASHGRRTTRVPCPQCGNRQGS